MKKFLSLLLALIMCISSVNIVLAEETELPPYSGGNGSEDNPYEITTEEDLRTLAEQVNGRNAYEGTYFHLKNDIVLSGDAWTPIGVGEVDANTKEFLDNGERSFRGIFDGDGHTISNVNLNAYAQLDDDGKEEQLYQHDVIGFFGYTYNATIKDLTIEGNIAGNERVGGIVGYAANGSYIQNCVNKANVYGENKIGGIAGTVGAGDVSHQRKVIDGCVNEGMVTANLYIYKKSNPTSQGVGGIVGYTDNVNTIIYNCQNKGDVMSAYSLSGKGQLVWRETPHYDGIGGIVGYVNAGTIEECVNKGNVVSETNVGGVVGTLNEGAKVINSGSDMANDGEVPEDESSIERPYVSLGVINLATEDPVLAFETNYTHECSGLGGVVGKNNGGEVTDCYAYYTDVYGMQEVGGIVGRNSGTVQNCTTENIVVTGSSYDYTKSNGTVVSPYFTYTGGIVGYNESTIDNCISKKNQVVSYYNAVGGICGYDSPTAQTVISNCKNIDSSITTDEVYEAMAGSSYNSRIGGIVGEGNKVINCSTEGETGVVLGNTEVGGIIGRNNGSIEDCHNMGTVTGHTYTGGIAGVNTENSTIKNCYNERFFKGEGSYLGGVVGQNKGLVEECYNTGEIQTTGGLLEHAGGVAGINSIGGVLNKCYNEASITGKNNIGGISGINSNGIIKNCYNEGTIFGQDKVGGIVGLNEWMSASSEDAKDAYILNNFNKGAVDGGTDVSTVGGISGINQGYIDNCYNSGSVAYTEAQAGYRGLITGQNDINLADYSKVMNSYSSEQTAPICGNDVENVVDKDTVKEVTKSQISTTLNKLNNYVKDDISNGLVLWGYKNGDAELLLNGELSNIARVVIEQADGGSVEFTDTVESYKFIEIGQEISLKIDLNEGVEFSGFMYEGGFISVDKMTVADGVYTFNAPQEYDVLLKPVFGNGVFILSVECKDGEGNVVDNMLDTGNISNIDVKVMSTNTELTGDLIAAAYDSEDNFVGIVALEKDIALSSSEVEINLDEVNIPSNTSQIKVFLWDGLDSMQPISNNTYEVSFAFDYEMDGMIMYLDGLRAGSEDNTNWYNLVGEDYFTLTDVTRTDRGFSFNGTSSYAQSSEKFDMGSSERTIEVSFANDSYNTTRSSYIFGMGTSDSSNLLIGRDKSGNILVYTGKKSYTFDYPNTEVKTVSVVVGDGTLKVYVNGVAAPEVYETSVKTSSGNIKLGNSSNSPTPSRQWEGELFVVRMYDRQLSDSEIAENYESDVERFSAN